MIGSTKEFAETLQNNPGIFIVKFGAEWCKPCKMVDPLIKQRMSELVTRTSPEIQAKIQCVVVDIDETLEVYSFLKTKKMVKGIPALLCWYAGNVNYIPDDSVLGADANEIEKFFERCFQKVSEKT